MSGHSHSKKIAHQKAATDAQRSSMFSKIAKEILLAAKGGSDPAANPRLRVAIERARSVNMPKDNVERAIQRGAGEGAEKMLLEEMFLEAYGPGDTALLIFAITDNKNRTLAEVKKILAEHQGKLVEGGAVRWMFEQQGILVMPPCEKQREEQELLAIEAGAQDVFWNEDGVLQVVTKPTELETAKKIFENKGVIPQSASLSWVPKESVKADQLVKEEVEKLLNALHAQEDVQEVYSNVEP